MVTYFTPTGGQSRPDKPQVNLPSQQKQPQSRLPDNTKQEDRKKSTGGGGSRQPQPEPQVQQPTVPQAQTGQTRINPLTGRGEYVSSSGLVTPATPYAREQIARTGKVDLQTAINQGQAPQSKAPAQNVIIRKAREFYNRTKDKYKDIKNAPAVAETVEQGYNRGRETRFEGRGYDQLAPYERRGTTTVTRTDPYTDEDLRKKWYNEAVDKVLVDRAIQETNAEAEKFSDRRQKVYQDLVDKKHKDLQDKINSGEITVEDATKQLEDYNKKVNDAMKRDINNYVDKISENKAKDLEKDLKQREARRVLAKVPFDIGVGAVTGVAIKGSKTAINVGKGLFYLSTAKVGSDVIRGKANLLDVSLFVTKAGAFGVGAYAGAKGSTLVESSKARSISKDLEGARVKSVSQEVRVSGTTKRALMEKGLSEPEITTLSDRGATVRFTETEVLPTKTGTKAPQTKGSFVEVISREGSSIESKATGTVTTRMGSRTASKDVLRFGEGFAEGGKLKTTSLLLEGKYNRGKFKTDTATRLDEETSLINRERIGTREMTQTQTKTTQVGETLTKPKAGQMEDLFLRDGKAKPVSKTETTSVFEEQKSYGKKSVPALVGDSVIQVAQTAKVETGRSISLTEGIPEKPKSSKGKSLIEDIYGNKDTKAKFETPSTEVTLLQPEKPTTTEQDLNSIPKYTGGRGTELTQSLYGNKGTPASNLAEPEPFSLSISDGSFKEVTLRGAKSSAKEFEIDLISSAKRAEVGTGRRSLSLTSETLLDTERNILMKPSDLTLSNVKPRELIRSSDVVGTSELQDQSTRQRTDTLISTDLTVNNTQSPKPTEPNLFEIPMLPAFGNPFDGGQLSKGSLASQKRGKRKTAYQASLGSVIGGVTQKVSKRTAKSLASESFTGLELRPMLDITSSKKSRRSKQQNIKRPSLL